jgi:hypothetical protein
MPSPDNVCSAVEAEADKAEAIRFIGGHYAGKTGWFRHARRERGALSWYVLIDLGDNKVLKTHVQRDNVIIGEVEEPASYATALLQQHTDIEATMHKLVRQLATCSIGDGNTATEICRIFVNKLHDAIKKQDNKGPKARYRYVHFADPNDENDEDL